jgi:hypothetical protein
MIHTIEIRPRTNWAADGPQDLDQDPGIRVTLDDVWGIPMIGVTFTQQSHKPWFMSCAEAGDLIDAIHALIEEAEDL